MQQPLKGKITLVTGASRGIGYAVATKFAQEGAYVIGTATTEAGIAGFNEFLKSQQLTGHGVVMDVANKANVIAVITELAARNLSPEILVNNAGITRDNLLLRMDDEEWDSVIETNLSAIYRVTKAVLRPMLKARWGRIINIGSVVGSSGNAGQVNYAAAKAGIIGFTKSLAQEIGSKGITANVVAPGLIDTDMTRTLPDMFKEALMKQIPVRCFGEVTDIAAAVVFLASPCARYITGQTLHVNGGLYMD